MIHIYMSGAGWEAGEVLEANLGLLGEVRRTMEKRAGGEPNGASC